MTKDKSEDEEYENPNIVIPDISSEDLVGKGRRLELGEAVARAIVTLDKGDILKFSRLSKEEERVFALWYAIAKKYNLKTIDKFIITSLRMRISIDGNGRQDIVRIASSAVSAEREAQSGGFRSRVRDLMGI